MNEVCAGPLLVSQRTNVQHSTLPNRRVSRSVALFTSGDLSQGILHWRRAPYLGIPNLHTEVPNRPGYDISRPGCVVSETDIQHGTSDNLQRRREHSNKGALHFSGDINNVKHAQEAESIRAIARYLDALVCTFFSTGHRRRECNVVNVRSQPTYV